MARSRLYRILERPAFYRFVQTVLAPGWHDLTRSFDEVLGECGGRVLDVGCGPTVSMPLPSGTIVGCDVNADYVARYVEPRAGEREDCEKLGAVGSAAALPFSDGSFDESRCSAVLHHLPTDLACVAIAEMVRVVRPGGRVVIFDTVWPPSPGSAPIAWLLCRFDRGEWMRTPEQLARLANEAFDGPWRARTVVYSWYRIRGALLTLDRP